MLEIELGKVVVRHFVIKKVLEVTLGKVVVRHFVIKRCWKLN